jgi:quinol monooxygenase YgiN
MSVSIVVLFDVKPERLTDTLHAFEELATQTRTEDGAVIFDVHTVEERPSTVVLIEEWIDQRAIDLHMKEPYTAQFLDRVDGAFRSAQQVLRLTPLVT